MATDRELIEKVQHGEREVYGQLFQKYYAQIYAICLAMLGNQHDAEELAQEVFVLGYLRLDQLRQPERFFPWLKKITRNRSRNHMQKAGLRLVPLDLASSHKAPDAPDERILRQEFMDSIMGAVEALPARDREVVQARIDGLNHTEISQRFGISAQASMSRLSRSRQRLADHMKSMLSVIVGLPKVLPFKKLISGGIIAMKAGTGAKVTIGIIGIIMAGLMGFLISTHQLNATKAGEGQISATTEQGDANASAKTSDASAGEHSGKQGAMYKDEEEGWNAVMQMLGEMAETSDTKTTDLQSGTKATSSETENSETSQDQQEMEYHEAYDTFIGITKNINQTKAQIDLINEEVRRLTDELESNVRDPENPTAEEKLLATELKEDIASTQEERMEIMMSYSSLANKLMNEIKAAAPGAVHTEYQDMPGYTIVHTRIDYEHIQSELGPLPEEDDAYLAEFFTLWLSPKSGPKINH